MASIKRTVNKLGFLVKTYANKVIHQIQAILKSSSMCPDNKSQQLKSIMLPQIQTVHSICLVNLMGILLAFVLILPRALFFRRIIINMLILMSLDNLKDYEAQQIRRKFINMPKDWSIYKACKGRVHWMPNQANHCATKALNLGDYFVLIRVNSCRAIAVYRLLWQSTLVGRELLGRYSHLTSFVFIYFFKITRHSAEWFSNAGFQNFQMLKFSLKFSFSLKLSSKFETHRQPGKMIGPCLLVAENVQLKISVEIFSILLKFSAYTYNWN